MAESKQEGMRVILAVFDNESAAVGAQAGLEHWAGTRRDIKLGAVGFLQMENGEVRSTLVRKEGKGVLVNGAMGLVKSMLGPIALVGDAVTGVAKSLFGKEDDEAPPALQKLGAYMDAGGVTMVTAVREDQEARAFSSQLQAMGGRVTIYTVPQEVLDEVATAVETAQAEAEAAEKAAKEAEKAAKEAQKAAKENE